MKSFLTGILSPSSVETWHLTSPGFSDCIVQHSKKSELLTGDRYTRAGHNSARLRGHRILDKRLITICGLAFHLESYMLVIFVKDRQRSHSAFDKFQLCKCCQLLWPQTMKAVGIRGGKLTFNARGRT